MSIKILAIGTAILLVLMVSVGFLGEGFLAVERLNPIAAIAAFTVVLIGVVWLNRIAKSTF